MAIKSADQIVGYTDCRTTANICTHVLDGMRRIVTANPDEVFGNRGK